MRELDSFNPLALLVYFLAVTLAAMFAANPVLGALSLAGALALYLRVGQGRRMHLWCALLLVLSALVNPIFNHNGVTVLFVMNNNPVTLEALLYGLSSGVTLVSVLYWFASFSRLMTGDKLLYILGSASPKLSLVVSMALRYVPLFAAETRKVNAAQRCMGLYRDENLPDRLRGGARVFSVMVSWALENGVITADSMEARGYGVTRRTFFARYRFRKSDAALLAATLILAVPLLWAVGRGAAAFTFYPALTPPPDGALLWLGYGCYALLCLLPALITTFEEIKWTYLLSKI